MNPGFSRSKGWPDARRRSPTALSLALALRTLSLALTTLLWAHTADAIELSAGDILVSDSNKHMVVLIDPETGDRTIITSKKLGTGGGFGFPLELQLPSDGSVLLADLNRQAILRIDPATGNKVIVSSKAVGCCGILRGPRTIELDRDGSLIVADSHRDELIRIDLATGDRKVISSDRVGTGPGLRNVLGLSLLPAGEHRAAELVAVDSALAAIFRIDLANGNRTIVSSNEIGEGPRYDDPFDIVVVSEGSALVVDKRLPGVLRVDLATGDRTLLSGRDAGSGPAFKLPFGMALEADGSILVTDFGLDLLFRVDPVTGDRTILSSAEVGEGPIFGAPRRVAVVPGIRRSSWGTTTWSLAVAAVGIVALSSFWVIRKRIA